jgi:hypothetical protein
LRRDELAELQNIVHRDNLQSILQRGILSHDGVARLPHRSVADHSVQDRRASIVVPPTRRRLHTYANLYFNARNIMMYRVLCDLDWQRDQLCVVGVSTDVLDLPGVVVTDRNAASWPWWKAPNEALPLLDRATIFAPRWNHADEMQKRDHQQRMCAEVLVPDRVAPELIRRIYVPAESCRASAEAVSGGMMVEVKGPLFFHG